MRASFRILVLPSVCETDLHLLFILTHIQLILDKLDIEDKFLLKTKKKKKEKRYFKLNI